MKHSLLSLICFLSITISFAQSSPALVHHKRQFRGVWMATVRNLGLAFRAGHQPPEDEKGVHPAARSPAGVGDERCDRADPPLGRRPLCI
jgi:hypothetical protein